MAEEAGNQKSVDQPAPVVTQEQQDLANTVSSLGFMLSDKTKNELATAAAGAKPDNTETPEPAKKADVFEEGAEGQEQEEEEAAEEGAESKEKKDDPTSKEGKDKKDNKKEEKVEKPNAFGLKKPGKKTPDQPVEFENLDKVTEFVSQKFGMKLEKPSDLPKFFEQSQNWRKDSEKLKTVEQTHQQVVDAIAGLPAEFHEAFKAYESGDDWRSPFAKPAFDFNVPADKQNVKDLVNHYFPGDFTDADFEEETPSTAIKIATKTAKEKYSTEKTAYDTKRAGVFEDQRKRDEAYSSSVASSVKNIEQSFPDADPDKVKLITDMLSGGPASVMSYLFEKDGSVKASTAENLMMAMYGKEVLLDAWEIGANQRESEINEKNLTRGADRKAPKQTGNAPGPQLTEEEQKAINEVKRMTESQKSKNSVFN